MANVASSALQTDPLIETASLLVALRISLRQDTRSVTSIPYTEDENGIKRELYNSFALTFGPGSAALLYNSFFIPF
jgi:hypothetical protein